MQINGRQCIYAPSDHYALLKERLMQYSLGYYEDSVYGMVVDCHQIDQLKDVSFHINGNWYEWLRGDWLIEIGSSYQC